MTIKSYYILSKLIVLFFVDPSFLIAVFFFQYSLRVVLKKFRYTNQNEVSSKSYNLDSISAVKSILQDLSFEYSIDLLRPSIG